MPLPRLHHAPEPRRRIPHQRATPAVALVIAALLFAGSTVAAQEAGQRRGQRIGAHGGPQAAPASTTSTPAPEEGDKREPAPPTTAPTRTAAEPSAPSPGPTSTKPPPTAPATRGAAASPSAPDHVVPPGSDFYTSDAVSATNGRLKVSLRVFVPNRPLRTAQQLKWLVNWEDSIGYISKLRVDYGDGAVYETDVPYSCWQGRDQSTMAHPAGVHHFPHAYRRPGQYVARVWVTTSSCTGGDATTEISMTSPPVEMGATPSNGPDTGHVISGINSRPGDDPALWKLMVEAADYDGYVRRVDFAWGDGHRDVVEFPLAECLDPGTHWPSSMRKFPIEHRFPTEDRARHSVTVISTSVGCDGASPQSIGGREYFRTEQRW